MPCRGLVPVFRPCAPWCAPRAIYKLVVLATALFLLPAHGHHQRAFYLPNACGCGVRGSC